MSMNNIEMGKNSPSIARSESYTLFCPVIDACVFDFIEHQARTLPLYQHPQCERDVRSFVVQSNASFDKCNNKCEQSENRTSSSGVICICNDMTARMGGISEQARKISEQASICAHTRRTRIQRAQRQNDAWDKYTREKKKPFFYWICFILWIISMSGIEFKCIVNCCMFELFTGDRGKIANAGDNGRAMLWLRRWQQPMWAQCTKIRK